MSKKDAGDEVAMAAGFFSRALTETQLVELGSLERMKKYKINLERAQRFAMALAEEVSLGQNLANVPAWKYKKDFLGAIFAPLGRQG